MKKKSLADMSGQQSLSRAQLKAVVAGKLAPDPQCACSCPSGPPSGFAMGGTCFCSYSGSDGPYYQC